MDCSSLSAEIDYSMTPEEFDSIGSCSEFEEWKLKNRIDTRGSPSQFLSNFVILNIVPGNTRRGEGRKDGVDKRGEEPHCDQLTFSQ